YFAAQPPAAVRPESLPGAGVTLMAATLEKARAARAGRSPGERRNPSTCGTPVHSSRRASDALSSLPPQLLDDVAPERILEVVLPVQLDRARDVALLVEIGVVPGSKFPGSANDLPDHVEAEHGREHEPGNSQPAEVVDADEQRGGEQQR